MEKNSKKRKAMDISEKVEIIQAIESGLKNVEVCSKFNKKSSTVSTIWKNRQQILDDFKSMNINVKKKRTCDDPELDKALYEWFKAKRIEKIPINGPILQIQANILAKKLGRTNFECSTGWIDRFKKRYNIVFGKVSGEAGSVNLIEVDDWINKIWKKIKNDYSDADIFNFDETGLFYQLMPDKTLKFKNETCSGGKLSKQRITFLVGANLNGTEKVKLLVIGKSKKPRAFKNIKNLPVDYTSNKKAWMTSEIFTSILIKWDLELQKQKRKIVLLVDNCSAHCEIKNLKNIKLVFFPPNVTSVLQPMDQGIIRSLKCHYRKLLILHHINKATTDFKVSILDAVRFVAEAWISVTSKTIKNCFIESGIAGKKMN